MVCAPGLEAVLADELVALGVRPRRRIRGGVEATLTDRELYQACLWLRTAARVLVRVARFRARTFEALVDGADAIDWERWITPTAPVVWKVTAHRSRLHHTGAIAERVEAALTRAVPPGAAAADHPGGEQPIVVRVADDEVTVSVDACGEGLHRRGWRREVAKAPLRPTLAAAALAAAGWDGSTPVVDPFCGSGTIPIEAARAARDLPPTTGRALAVQAWPCFAPGTWASVQGEAAGRSRPRAAATILGADRDAGAVAATRANAERADVGDDVTVAHQPLSGLSSPLDGPGWIVTNPPWGRRIGQHAGGGDLRDLYAGLGNVVRERFEGWGVAIVAADRALAGHTGLDLAPRWQTTSGGAPVQLLVRPPEGRQSA